MKNFKEVRYPCAIAVLLSTSLAHGESEKMGLSIEGSMAQLGQPLSYTWLHNWASRPVAPFTDAIVAQLAGELDSSGPPETDAWSQRTAQEIRSAIQKDDLLSKNSWSGVRCSPRGCIAAIEPLEHEPQKRQAAYKARLLSYLTPRLTQNHHVDVTTTELDSMPGASSSKAYVVFVLFSGGGDHTATQRKSNDPNANPPSEILAAKQALEKEQWSQALDHLKTAEQTGNLNDSLEKEIYELLGYAYARLNKRVEAQAAFESALPFALKISKQDASQDARRLLLLAELNKDYLKSIEVGRGLVSQFGDNNPNDLAVISESFFALSDCKYAQIWADKSVAAADQAHAPTPRVMDTIRSDCQEFNEAEKAASLPAAQALMRR